MDKLENCIKHFTHQFVTAVVVCTMLVLSMSSDLFCQQLHSKSTAKQIQLRGSYEANNPTNDGRGFQWKEITSSSDIDTSGNSLKIKKKKSKWFKVTEAIALYRFTDYKQNYEPSYVGLYNLTEYSLNHESRYVGLAQFGFLHNFNSKHAAGLVTFFRVSSDELGFGITGRYRRWFNHKYFLDSEIGLKLAGNDVPKFGQSPRVLFQISGGKSDWVALTARVELNQFSSRGWERYDEIEKHKRASFYGGLRLGKKAGVVTVAVAIVALGVGLLVVLSQYDGIVWG